MTEEQQIASAQRGDKDAFKALYERHSANVFRVCLRLLYRRALAEEATQEVFVKVWQQLPNFDGHSRLATWLYRIAVNTAIDLLRKNRMGEAEIPNSEIVQEQVGGVLGEEEMLLQLIANLPERARLVFVLYAIEGRTHKEVAGLLNISEGASKSHYSRAREQLQKWWNAYEVA